MATHKSAAKRSRQAKRKTGRNTRVTSALKTFEKKVRTAVAKKDMTLALSALKNFISEFDKAASKGIVHAKKAARKVGRLSTLVDAIRK